jgi:RecB family exonuclease
VLATLDRRAVPIGMIRHFEPIDGLAPLWRRVFGRLATNGVRITETPLSAVRSGGDLWDVRSGRPAATGDGTIQLVRPQGPLEAADDVAAALAVTSSLDGIVIVTPDSTLDRALIRHGLPGVGADVPPPASAVLVRLCIECAFDPADPAVLHALLVADPGPVPRGLAAGLAWALAKFPARGTSQWRTALAKGLAGFADDARTDIADRVSSLLDAIAPRDGTLAQTHIVERLHRLAAWARGRCDDEPSLREVAAQANQFVELVRRRGKEQLHRRELLRLCDEVDRVVVAGTPAQVGLNTASAPGAVLAPARTVIWWGFTRDRVRRRRGPRLSCEERAALCAAGVVLPDTSIEMMGEARMWRRPLDLATEALVLVCPYADAVGDRSHPHPLWDEIVASSSPELVHRLRRSRVALHDHGAFVEGRRERAVLRAVPTAANAARTGRVLTIEDTETVSDIELLVGCSLAYVLRRTGRLRRRLPDPPLEPSPLLFGNIAHHILARAFAHDTSWTSVEEIANAEVLHLSEALRLPDHHAERVMLVRAIIASARLLEHVIAISRAKVRGVELPLAGIIAGSLTVEGRADLVLDEPPVVVDLKWGASIYREQLRAGTAIQLAIYAALAGVSTGAYLALRDQRLMSTPGCGLRNASEPGAYSIDEISRAATAAVGARMHELRMGQLLAPGALVDVTRSRIDAGRIDLAPPCDHCELDGMCGRRGRT